MEINQITGATLAAAVTMHRHLGPGLLESVYQACLAAELDKQRLEFRREVMIPMMWDGVELDASYRLDFLVEAVWWSK